MLTWTDLDGIMSTANRSPCCRNFFMREFKSSNKPSSVCLLTYAELAIDTKGWCLWVYEVTLLGLSINFDPTIDNSLASTTI